MGKQSAIMIVMGILLLGALGYIGYIQYGQIQQNKQVTAYATFQQGAQYGTTQTISTLMSQLAQCPKEGVPVYNQNLTIHVVALECYQQQAQQQPQR